MVDLAVADGATAPPAVGVPSDDNGWDTGLRDGDYTVAADLWWGTNATSWSLAENGVVVGEGALEAATPGAQHVEVDRSGRAPGEYSYVVTFAHALGATQSRPMTVRVR